MLAGANTARAYFRLRRGTPRFVATSARFRRAFCAGCGTVLWSESIDLARWNMVSGHHGTVDRAEQIEPALHICRADCLPWFRTDDALRRAGGGIVPLPGAHRDPRQPL